MSEQMLIRLRREIQVLRSMDHPNIIGLHEIFEEGSFLYMVMELASGGELWHFLQKVEVSTSPAAQQPQAITLKAENPALSRCLPVSPAL